MPLLFKLKASVSVQNLHLLDLLNRSVIALNLPASVRIGESKQQLSCAFFALQSNEWGKTETEVKKRWKRKLLPSSVPPGPGFVQKLAGSECTRLLHYRNFPVTSAIVDASPMR